MKRQWLIYGSLAAFIVIMLVWWFFHTFEYREEIKDTGFSAEARQNPYLAAERFLEKFDMHIKTVPSMLELTKFPKTSDVLFIPTGRYDLSLQKDQALLKWVRRGGHLIVRARKVRAGDTAADDGLLHLLGVQTHEKRQKGKAITGVKMDVVDVHVNSKIENKKVDFNINHWIKDTGKYPFSWRVNGKHGSQLLEYQLGDGYVSLLSDMRFMDNLHIAKHDNAAFLYTLVHMNQDNHRIWIVRDDNMPSLLSLISKKTPASVVSLLILLLCWLWYTTRRFGPLRRPELGSRRSLHEHIAASGMYLWRNHHQSTLFRNVKTALLEQIAQVRPLWMKLGDEQLATKLSKLAGIPANRILTVLQANTVEKETEFTQYIEILSLIRKKL